MISGGGVTNIDEPGMYRTSDGVLHVAMMRGNASTDSIDVAHISPSGKLLGRQAVLDNWEGLTEDPDFVPGAAGGIRMVFGGHTGSTGDPYAEGYVYTTSSDPTGTVWTLAPNTQPAIAHTSGYASYGTGAATLADGTLVSAYPLNSAITTRSAPGPWGRSPSTCAAPTTWRWPRTASTPGPPGMATAAPTPPTRDPGPPDPPGARTDRAGPAVGERRQPRLGGHQPGCRHGSPRNGIYLAYLKGYPTAKAVTRLEVRHQPRQLGPRVEGADTVALSVGPAGRLWLAWDDASDDIRAVRTDPKGLTFGAVQLLKTPGDASVYHVNIEGSAGHGDVVFNDCSRSCTSRSCRAQREVRPREVERRQVGEGLLQGHRRR